MFTIQPSDDELTGLAGAVVRAPQEGGASYQLVRQLAAGSQATAMLALRETNSGVTPAVVKILRPSFVRQFGTTAVLSFEKEALALRKLGERVPPTPFVLRLMDVGTVQVSVREQALTLGWLALEHVHGGAEGTTLTERVGYSIEKTGAAFDPLRAADAVRCIGQGIEAVHDLGVIHRDLKPANVLCCGFGPNEIFKIADFGLARSGSMAATFQGSGVGTPGYAAPEQLYGSNAPPTPASDVFSFAAVIYYLLTGEDYFEFRSLADMVKTLQSRERKPLAAASRLAGELRDNHNAVRLIEQALGKATAFDPQQRWQTARELTDAVARPLTSRGNLRRSTLSRLPDKVDAEAPTDRGWRWLALSPGWSFGVVRNAAWDGDGRALVAATGGLVFWNGSDWQPALPDERALPVSAHAVHRVGPAQWIVAGERATAARYSLDGVEPLARGQDPRVCFDRVSGAMNEVLVFTGSHVSGRPSLYSWMKRGWVGERELGEWAVVNAIARCEPTRWFLCGRNKSGSGVVALFTPLGMHLEVLDTPPVRAFTACAADAERGLAIAVGTDGAVVVFDGDDTRVESISGAVDLSAAAVDVGGGFWAGGRGQLWYRMPGTGARWLRVWQDERWSSPFASLFADSGHAIALAADGAVLEGRTSASAHRAR